MRILFLLIPNLVFSWTVCLDPGHGGSDPGATGLYYYEKDANLHVANWAKSYLEQVPEITNVGMTRSSDIDVSLEDRVNYANTNSFDRFISIHQNAFDGSVQGTETYCYTYGSANSFALRDSTHPELVKAYFYNDRGVKTADYYVLHYTNMPAILGEGSFIDYNGSYNESWRFAYDWYAHRARQGYAYTKGLCKHLNLSAPSFVLYTNYPESVYADSNFTVRDSFYVPSFQANIDLVFEIKSSTSGNILYTERISNISSGTWIKTFGLSPLISLPDSGYDYYVYFLSYIVPTGGNWNNRFTYVSTSLLPTKVKSNPVPDTSFIVYKSFPTIAYADSNIYVQDSFFIAPSQSPADLIFEIKHRENGNILYQERLSSLGSGYWIKTFGLSPEIRLTDSLSNYNVHFLSVLTPPGGGWSNRYTFASTYATPTTVLTNSPSYIIYMNYPLEIFSDSSFSVQESIFIAESQSPADLIFEVKDRTTGNVLSQKRIENLNQGYYTLNFIDTLQDIGSDYSVYFLSVLTPPSGSWENRYRYKSTYTTPTLVKTNQTGIFEIQNNKNYIYSYPNPSDGNITFIYSLEKEYKDLKILIYDITGRMKYKISLEDKNIKNVKLELDNGIYFYSLYSNDNILANNRIVILK